MLNGTYSEHRRLEYSLGWIKLRRCQTVRTSSHRWREQRLVHAVRVYNMTLTVSSLFSHRCWFGGISLNRENFISRGGARDGGFKKISEFAGSQDCFWSRKRKTAQDPTSSLLLSGIHIPQKDAHKNLKNAI